MIKELMMISPEEVRVYIPYAPEDSCKTISRYIKGLYLRKHSFMDSEEYMKEVIIILERVATNYNPKLGHLVRYAKNTLSLKMKDYVTRNYVATTQITDDAFVESVVTDIIDKDLSEYSDATIKAIYNVISGNGSKKEKGLVNELFNVKEI